MDFISFALSYGLEIRTFHDDGKWHRCRTTDKPNHYNGAYKFCGDHGFVQNHATMDKVEVWKTDRPVDIREYQAKAKQAQASIKNAAQDAANKAAWMLSKATPQKHDYFHRKGFPDHVVMTLERDDKKLALLPMRVDNRLTSLQIVVFENMKWKKTFLKGGVTKGATYRIGKGKTVLCEGFATGLSVQLALQKARIDAQVVVCFSANNMAYIAQKEIPALVIADNDESGTGERIAREIGVRYWISKTVGNDFNDDHLQRGIFAVSGELKMIMMKKTTAFCKAERSIEINSGTTV